MKFERILSPAVDDITWIKRDSKIEDGKGKIVFEQKSVEAPSTWSDNAVNIAASKYFKTINGVPENSVKQLFGRVVNTITQWGTEHKYFDSNQDSYNFGKDLFFILSHQLASFNSPVYFNIGVPGRPQQNSACFLLSVEDNMQSIFDWHRTEGLIFHGGSGSGINLSKLRAEGEPLSKGGTSSGPISFNKTADCQGGVIKSAGGTRRAARLVCLDIDHPDVLKFISCKSEEEKKARVLVEAGYGDGIDGEAYSTVAFQNANHSINLTNDFLSSVLQENTWSTTWRKSGTVAWTMKAKDVLREISSHAWETGDPGVIFIDTINEWNTANNTDKIYNGNPCLEYLHLPNSSCNLASLNLTKFIDEEGKFNIKLFEYVTKIVTTAMDILITNADFPTEKIAQVSRDYRELGIGYTNLGAMLMQLGLPYDSDKGRGLAFAITSLLSGVAYRQSALIAKELEPFAGFEKNREPMLKVLNKHLSYLTNCPEQIQEFIDVEDYQDITERALCAWLDTVTLTEKTGIRNSQISVVPPAGTISFLMDADTTGLEPDFSLVKIKSMVGGGVFKYINNSLEICLKRLGYINQEFLDIVNHVTINETIEGVPHIKEKHLSIFDCAVGCRYIKPMGHIRMMASIQPFISGGLSKTVNLPNHATIEDIENIYLEAWRLGLKSIAVYRDGCKVSQPLNTNKVKEKVIQESKSIVPIRKRLPSERPSITHKMDIGGFEGYLTAGLYPNGEIGELFIHASKAGSFTNHLLDALGVITSIALQYGVPLEPIVEKLINTRSEPSGFTKNPNIPVAGSVVDYIFKWLKYKFVDKKDVVEPEVKELLPVIHTNGNGHLSHSTEQSITETIIQSSLVNTLVETVEREPLFKANISGLMCNSCGGLLVQTGSCHSCPNCGTPAGGCG